MPDCRKSFTACRRLPRPGQEQSLIRSSLAAAVVVALALFAPPTAAIESGVQQTEPGCASGSQAQSDLCLALQTGSCGLAGSSVDYWFCKGILERQCGLIEDSPNYWFCEALRTRECGVVAGNRYQLCRGILERDCRLPSERSRWMCVVLQNKFSDGRAVS